MKLIIPSSKQVFFYAEFDSSEDDNADTAEEFHTIHKLLDSLNVNHSYDLFEESSTMTIYEQKITLDEIAMNDLFYNGLHLFDFDIRYSALGGAGCELALELIWK